MIRLKNNQWNKHGINISFLCFVCVMLLFTASSITLFPISANASTTVENPEFSVEGGLYQEGFRLELTSKDNNHIFYTLDGSIPKVGNRNTHLYKEALTISESALRETASEHFCGTVIRAICINEKNMESDVVTNSYFVSKDILDKYKLPVISLVSDPENLYDETIGILSERNKMQSGSDWERPMHFEYYNTDGKRELSINLGARLHGKQSRNAPYKSFRLYARKEYDEQSKMEYSFFENSVIPCLIENGEAEGEQVTEFKRLLLRNGGNEAGFGGATMYRDAFLQALASYTKLDLQSYQPAIAFLNGEYYSLLNIRERYDEDYLSSHYNADKNVDKNDFIIYEFSYNRGDQIVEIDCGEESDAAFYENVIDFMMKKDLSLKENYEQVKKWIDIENFVDYQIMNIWGCNGDWPGNNVKVWRYRTDYKSDAPYGLDGRLRWLLYDGDFCFSLYHSDYEYDMLHQATVAGEQGYPSNDGSTLFLRTLLHNEDFKRYFCQRYLDLMNTCFQKDFTEALSDSMADVIADAIDDQFERYGVPFWDYARNTADTFLKFRNYFCSEQLAKTYHLGNKYELLIDLTEEELHGMVKVNTLELTKDTPGVDLGFFRGVYLDKLETLVTAIPDDGYHFVKWQGSVESPDAMLDVSTLGPKEKFNLRPIFIKDDETGLSEQAESVVSAGEEYATQKKPDNSAIPFAAIIIVVFIATVIAGGFVIRKKKNNSSTNEE